MWGKERGEVKELEGKRRGDNKKREGRGTRV